MCKKWSLCLIVPILAFTIAGCSTQTEQTDFHEQHQPQQMGSGDLHEETAGADQLPSFLQGTDARVAQIYQLAAQHSDMIQHMPCYCGCGQSAGHRSNRDCFIKEIKKDGKIVWDSHAVTCYNCQQIALESIALKKKGKSLLEIRHFIDNKYKDGFAEPTPTPMPQES